MKKKFLTLALSGLMTTVLFSQPTIKNTSKKEVTIKLKPGAEISFNQSTPVKKDTAKVKYDYFAKLPVQDVQQYFGILNEYKRLVIYDPNATPEQKINIQQGIDKYLKTLNEKVKIDSLVKK